LPPNALSLKKEMGVDFQEMTVALRFFPSPSRSGALSDRSLNLAERGDNMLGRIAFKFLFSHKK